VLFKLASIVQLECASLTEHGAAAAMERVEHELVIMEWVTRRRNQSKTKRAAADSVEREALLKILDSIGSTLRFWAGHSSHGDEASVRRREHFLSLNLRILLNVTNGRSVTLKEETTRSLLTALGRFLFAESGRTAPPPPGHHELGCLALGVLINCCERNRPFRARFDTLRVDGVPVIDFLVGALVGCRAVVDRIEAAAESDDGEHSAAPPLQRRYMECKVQSFYLSLLLGFLLQSTVHFKWIAQRMQSDLSLLLECLRQFVLFLSESTEHRTAHSQRTLAVIAKIIQIVQLRNAALKRATVSAVRDPR